MTWQDGLKLGIELFGVLVMVLSAAWGIVRRMDDRFERLHDAVMQQKATSDVHAERLENLKQKDHELSIKLDGHIKETAIQFSALQVRVTALATAAGLVHRAENIIGDEH